MRRFKRSCMVWGVQHLIERPLVLRHGLVWPMGCESARSEKFSWKTSTVWWTETYIWKSRNDEMEIQVFFSVSKVAFFFKDPVSQYHLPRNTSIVFSLKHRLDINPDLCWRSWLVLVWIWGDAAGAQYCGKLLFCLSGLLKNSPMLQVGDFSVCAWSKH